MSKNRKRKSNGNRIDVSLLSCGLVEKDVFSACLDALAREAGEVGANVSVYLNGAPQESRNFFVAEIEKYDFSIKQTSERVGFPAGANRAIRQGTAPLFLFITDDIILHPGSLDKLLKRMDSNDKIGVCGMKLLFPDVEGDPARPAGRVQHIGHAIDIRGEVVHPLMGWKANNPKCCVNREVLSVTGGVFMARRQAFARAGGFFEGYGFGYYEDIDLNLTIRGLGYINWIEADATATHYTNMSMAKAENRPNLEANKAMFRSRKASELLNDSWSFW